MAAEASKPLVECLDVDNYATWRILMKYVLISKGLWAAVESDTVEHEADQKALATIGLYVKEHHLSTLERCGTAKRAWMELERVYQAKSNARKLQLRMQLSQLKMGATEPLTKYVSRAKEIQAQALGCHYALFPHLTRCHCPVSILSWRRSQPAAAAAAGRPAAPTPPATAPAPAVCRCHCPVSLSRAPLPGATQQRTGGCPQHQVEQPEQDQPAQPQH